MKIAVKMEIEAFKKAMAEKRKAVEKVLPESIKDGTLYLRNKVAESIARGTNASVAVDTGRFLNSVDIDTISENAAKVYTDLEYAQFIEYGTSKMESRPHFRNTAFVEQWNLIQVFNNKVKQAIK
jgi:hypothetical protein